MLGPDVASVKAARILTCSAEMFKVGSPQYFRRVEGRVDVTARLPPVTSFTFLYNVVELAFAVGARADGRVRCSRARDDARQSGAGRSPCQTANASQLRDDRYGRRRSRASVPLSVRMSRQRADVNASTAAAAVAAVAGASGCLAVGRGRRGRNGNVHASWAGVP